MWNKQPCAWFDGKYFMFLNKSISERRKACITNLLQVITNAVLQITNEGYKTNCAFASVE